MAINPKGWYENSNPSGFSFLNLRDEPLNTIVLSETINTDDGNNPFVKIAKRNLLIIND
ncbi:MAG: hypothetical protein Q8T04_02270 [Bacteroidota bacterium]|nr:hypothetical protein [Bacteroidota bacterium]